MNQEEENEKIGKEERYERSQDSIEQINRKIDRLTGVTGDLVTAIRGNDLGTPGIVGQIKDMKADLRKAWERQDDFDDRLSDLSIKMGSRDTQMRIIWGLACSLGTGLIFFIVQYFKK